MKILHVIDQFKPGGAERAAVDLINILFENNHQVEVLVLLRESDLDKQLSRRICVHYLNRNYKFSLWKVKQVNDLISKFDIVHVHMRHTLKYIVYCKLFSSWKTKILFHDQFGIIAIDKSVSLSLKYILSKVDFYIGVSRELTNWAIDVADINSARVGMLPNIARNNNRTQISPRFLRINKELDDSFKLVSVGNFRRVKNYEFLIELVDALPSNFNLVIYGNAVDQTYFDEIVNLISLKSLDSRIKIISSETNIISQLDLYDLAIHTSKSETGPIALIEYAVVGLPFLSYLSGQTSDVISKSLPKFFLKNFNLPNWLNSIHTFSKFSIQERIKYSRELKTLYSSHFSEKAYLSGIIKFYNIILGKA